MKNFFRVFLVGMILLGLSGLAGAEEWKQYDLTKVVELKVSVPTSFKDMGQDEKEGSEIVSAFVDEDNSLLIMTFKSTVPLETKWIFATVYGVDEFTQAQEEEFIKTFSKIGETGKFITLKSGRRALLVDINRSEATGQMIVVLKKGYLLGLMVLKEGVMRGSELKLPDQVFQKAVF